jgi:hypothetical protein
MGFGQMSQNLDDFENSDDFESRVKFISRVIPPEDMYEFADILFQMNLLLSTTLYEFTNLDTIFENRLNVKIAMNNILLFRLRMKNNDTRRIKMEKFSLNE